MILGDKEVRQLIWNQLHSKDPSFDGESPPKLDFYGCLIDPYSAFRQGPVSYDLTTYSYQQCRGIIRLETKEVINMPRRLAGLCSMRSRGEKAGLFWSGSALVDPGYKGRLHFLVYCPEELHRDVDLENLFQIIFMEVGEVEVAYSERSTSTSMGRDETKKQDSEEGSSVPDTVIRKRSDDSLPGDGKPSDS